MFKLSYPPIFFISLILLTTLPLCISKDASGTVNTKSNWKFLSKFCFGYGNGSLTWKIWPKDAANFRFLLYLDITEGNKGDWFKVYNNEDLTCEQKSNYSLVSLPVVPGIEEGLTIGDYARPHFWYVAVANCKAPKEIGIGMFQYDIKFLNPGGRLTRQFSYDEQGLFGMYLFYFLFYFFGLIVHLIGVWQLYRRAAFHPIVRLLTTTIVLEFVSIFCGLVHYGVYASDGKGAPGLGSLGELLHMSAIITFTFLLILISKGWAITSNILTDKNLLIVLVMLFLLGYIGLFIWDIVGRDPASTIYFYDSIPGIFVVVLRVLTLVWFGWCLYHTYHLETLPEKRKFYTVFGAALGVWFIALPIVVAIAAGIDPWMRAKVVNGLSLTVNALGFGALAFLLWPSRAQEYFSILPPPLRIGSEYGYQTVKGSSIGDSAL
eukprot:TRINITY_DN963_c0_g1_i1.p1 TRINITY_DN963_c0_g1~~TRINITY_DN963_c0_g1_i1.p1  ORF type:complete len:434 (-),score=47.48 TRINITY_DN963_c0_g1_i1:78-1379(-)